MRYVKEIMLLLCVGMWLVVFPRLGNCTQLPSFLPAFYSEAFSGDERELVLVKQTTKERGEQYLYRTEGNTFFLSVENIKADAPKVRGVMGNIFRLLNNEMEAEGGDFISVGRNEVHARLGSKEVARTVLVYALPSEVQIWSYSGVGTATMDFQSKFESLRSLANRQRYLEAVAEGNVAMGSWGEEIHSYAMELLKKGKKEEAIGILKAVIATSPSNYRAHHDFLSNTTDAKAAENSARIIVKNAEDADIIEPALRYLNQKPKTMDSIPYLEKGERGLKVILVPLVPCDVSLLDDVAATYQKITALPVKIRRLKEPFQLGSPDRFSEQRLVQELIIRFSGENTVFTGWNRDKHLSELKIAAERKDPWTRYNVKVASEKIAKDEGQYLVDPYLQWFLTVLERYRSDDARTMYVGITSANIFSGDNNFLFSLAMSKGSNSASILSYYMMLAKNANDSRQSRQRLIERAAKELVPASLKLLSIPRSSDPSCPYSYSDGVPRLDEKTLQLSEGVKVALDGLRKGERK